MCSIKTFTQTWYNKQKQDLDLMKNYSYFFFSFQSPKHTNVNQAPCVQWKRIQVGQRRDTGDKNQTERWQEFTVILLFLYLILRDEQKHQREGNKRKVWEFCFNT